MKGLGIKIKRKEGTEKNPWIIDIKAITNKEVELLELI